MSEDAILEHIRVLCALTTEIQTEQREQRARLGAIERTLCRIERDVAERRVEVSGRFDRVLDRLDRIDHLLGLADTP